MIQRGTDQFGPYTLEQVQTFLADGSLAENDLAWYEGLSEWQPISSLFEIERISHPTTPLPPPPPSQSAGKPRKGRSKAEKVFWTIFLGGGALFGLLVIVGYISSIREEMASASIDPAPRKVSQSKEKSKPRREQSSSRSVLEEPVIEEVDLFDLQETHSKNSLFFEETYKGKTLRVTGEIAKIDRKPITKTPYVNLQAPVGGGKFIEDLSVVFDDNSLAAKLTAGTVITVVGRADGVNELRRPQIRDAVVESVRSLMEPYPGIVWEPHGEGHRRISADTPQVIHAAKLFSNSLKNPIFERALSGARNQKLMEIVKWESRENQTLYRFKMGAVEGNSLQTIQAWVMVTENADGSFEMPNEGDFDMGGRYVSHVGELPVQAFKRIREINGWAD